MVWEAAHMGQKAQLFPAPTTSSSLGTRTTLLQKGAKASTSISPEHRRWIPLQLRWLITILPRYLNPRNATGRRRFPRAKSIKPTRISRSRKKGPAIVRPRAAAMLGGGYWRVSHASGGDCRDLVS